MKPETPRSLPQDIEIEQMLLGSIILDNRLIDVASGTVEAGDFAEPLHRTLFDMICALASEGDVNPVILASVLKSNAALAEMGGIGYLVSLAQAAPSKPNIEQLCARLIDLSERRALIGIAEDMTADAYDAPATMKARVISERATESLLSIGLADQRAIVSPYNLAMESLRRVEAMKHAVRPHMVTTGLEKVDHALGGFAGGELVVLAGKSSMGKSALMASMSLRSAMAGYPTIVFSLEMTASQWIDRCVCDLAYEVGRKPLFYSQIRKGRMDHDEISRFMEAARALEDLPLEIIDTGRLSVAQMTGRARAFKAKHGNVLGAVYSDYLQITEPSKSDDRSRNREQAVSGIARDYKALSKILRWPVIVGSQLNEDDKNRNESQNRPQLRDLRESKAIVHEADIVIAPHRPIVLWMNKREPGWRAELSDRERQYREGIRNELTAEVRLMQFGVLKARGDAITEIDLWCDMGANAIRDEEPRSAAQSVRDRDLLDMVP